MAKKRGKVSMVVPCYNKADYIGDMLDSVIAQVWDNIEVILVNDGSTDGTREIIAVYEPKLKARGYEVVVIDQENAGVCAAAKAGLQHVTGQYVCMVDSDDELDSQYVSTMAGWLEANTDYDITACEGITYTGCGSKKVFSKFTFREICDEDPDIVGKWLLGEFRATVWIYMLRVDYFRKCRIVETYYTDTKGSHEPGYIIPLLAFGGKLKFFPLPLYHFNASGDGHSQFRTFEHMHNFYIDYVALCMIAIEALPDSAARLNNVGESEKKRLITLGKLGCLRLKYRYLNSLPGTDQNLPLVLKEISEFIDAVFCPSPAIPFDRMQRQHRKLLPALENAILHREKAQNNGDGDTTGYRRIIGYGALGKSALWKLEHLEDTCLYPNVFWDMTARNGSMIYGEPVTQPDFDSVTDGDLIIVLPGDATAQADIKALLETKRICNYIFFNDIGPNVFFPELFSNSRFEP